MKKIVSLPFYVILLWCFCQSLSAKDYQFNLNIGQDDPDAGEARESGASLIKFSLTTKPSTFRLGTHFTYLTGGNLTQGETGLALYIYPLAYKSRSPVQPFLWAEGTFGLGTFNEVSRSDSGMGLGAGVDLLFGRDWGATIAVEQKSATETASRLWLGLFWN